MKTDPLDWCAINLGGNMIHRFRSIMEKRSGLLNHQPTVGTHIKQSTYRLVSISRNGEDYTIHFQMLLISNIARIMKIKNYDELGVSQFASILACNTCTRQFTEIVFDLSDCTNSNKETMSVIKQTDSEELLLNPEISPSVIITALSIYSGRIFGDCYDHQLYEYYFRNRIVEELEMTGQLMNLSINDFRYIDCDFLIIGMIQNSKRLRAMKSQNEYYDASFVTYKGADHLATYLLNSGRLHEFFKKIQFKGL